MKKIHSNTFNSCIYHEKFLTGNSSRVDFVDRPLIRVHFSNKSNRRYTIMLRQILAYIFNFIISVACR